MSEARLLLVEKDGALAGDISSALEAGSISPLHAANLADVKEALQIQQFDVILLGYPAEVAMTAELFALAHALNPPIPVLSYGNEGAQCDGAIPRTVPLSELASTVKRMIQNSGTNDEEGAASPLAAFDADGFSEQMGGDSDLMQEIIGIYIAESGEQVTQLREMDSGGDFYAASRIAHSIKGSLGSIHAPRARYWAQVLEAAALAGDKGRYKRALVSLERSMAELEPHLRQLLDA